MRFNFKRVQDVLRLFMPVFFVLAVLSNLQAQSVHSVQMDDHWDEVQKTKQLVWLSVTSSADELMYMETLLGFLKDATVGVDRLYDAVIFREKPYMLYSLIDESEYRYIIQGLPFVENVREIPLGISIGYAGAYSFNIEDTQNFPDYLVVELVDNFLGQVHNLTDDGSYPFIAQSEYENSSRFSLRVRDRSFVVNSLSVSPSPEIELSVKKDGIYITNASSLPSLYYVSVIDITGKTLFEKMVNTQSGFLELPYEFQSNKPYLIKVNTDVHKVIFD